MRYSKARRIMKAIPGEADSSEQGSALIEFIGLSALLMVPTVYFLLAVFSIQLAAFAASNASAQALQVVQQLPADQAATSHVQGAAELAASDFGFAHDQVQATIVCENTCARNERMTITVTVDVQLPLMPWPGAPTMATMTSSATSWGGAYS